MIPKEGSERLGGAEGAEAVDAYIAQFPEAVRDKLLALRETIRENAPGAEERLSYSMPAFRLHENLVYYAAFTRHIGFFPTSGPIVAFQEELGAFKTSKGAVQFPLDGDLPLDLVARMVRYRMGEMERKSELRPSKN